MTEHLSAVERALARLVEVEKEHRRMGEELATAIAILNREASARDPNPEPSLGQQRSPDAEAVLRHRRKAAREIREVGEVSDLDRQRARRLLRGLR